MLTYRFGDNKDCKTGGSFMIGTRSYNIVLIALQKLPRVFTFYPYDLNIAKSAGASIKRIIFLKAAASGGKI